MEKMLHVRMVAVPGSKWIQSMKLKCYAATQPSIGSPGIAAEALFSSRYARITSALGTRRGRNRADAEACST